MFAKFRFDWHIMFVAAGFIPARKIAQRMLRAGINPTLTLLRED